MPLDLGVDPGTLSRLAELPGIVQDVVDQSTAVIDAIRSGQAPGNPLSDLLGQLTDLAGQLTELPSLDAETGVFGGLADLIPVDLPDPAALRDGIDVLTAVLQPLADIVSGGDVSNALAIAVEEVVAGGANLVPGGDDVTEVLGQLDELFRLLGAVDRWAAAPPDADAVVDLLSRALIGVAPDLLDTPAAAIDAALSSLDVLDDVDAAAWLEVGQTQLDLWASIEAQLDAGPTIDWLRLDASMREARATLLASIAHRDGVVSGVVGRLRGIDGGLLSPAVTALLAVPPVQPVRFTPILDGMRRQLQGMRDELRSWTPEPADARRLVRRAVESLLEAVEQSPLGQVRGALLGLEQRVIAALDLLPLRSFARQLSVVFADVADAVADLDLESLRRPIDDLAGEVRGRLDAVPVDDVVSAVRGVWEAAESAVGEAAELLGELSELLSGVSGSLAGFVEGVAPLMSELNDILDTIGSTLDGFDLSEPAAVVVNDLHEARDVVAAIDVSNLPGPLVQAVDAAAASLADVDVMAEVRGPLDELLSSIDPTPLLEGAVDMLAGVSEELRALDPTSVVAELDGPVDALLEGLASFDPRQLEGLLNEALAPVRQAIESLDAATLLAPLTAAFADVLARLDETCAPERLLAPLQDLYQPVIDLVDELDPTRLVSLLAPHVGTLAGSVGPAAGPPAAVAGGGGVLRDLPSAVDTSDDLFGFRPGDLLVPAIDLHGRLMSAVDLIDATVLEVAGPALHERFAGRLALLSPASVMGRVEAAFDGLHAAFGAVGTGSRLGDAVVAYHRVAARVHVAAGGLSEDDPNIGLSVNITAALPELDPQRLVPSVAQMDALHLAMEETRGRLDLDPLRTSFAAQAPSLERIIPTVFRGGPLDGSGLRAALAALDPSPVRDEVNATFDEIGAALVGLEDVLVAALEEAGLAAEELLLPLNPGQLLTLAGRVHSALAAEVRAFAPSSLAAMLNLPYAAVRQQLAALDPAPLAGGLDEIRDGLLAAVDELVAGVVPDGAVFHELQARLAELRPSRLLADVTAALEPVSQLVANLDPAQLLQPLIDLLARVREQLPEALAQIEAAFDELLRAFPSGRGSGASGTVSIG